MATRADHLEVSEGASVRLMGDPLTTKNALATKFIAYELPADFVQDFAGDRAAVTAVIGRLIRAGVKEVNIVDVTHATPPTATCRRAGIQPFSGSEA